MREIKFRAKDRVGVWVYGDLRLTSREPHIWTDPYTSHIINTETIGQYTGLKDKNGKEIYEGDIIRYTDFDSCAVHPTDEYFMSYVEYWAVVREEEVRFESGTFLVDNAPIAWVGFDKIEDLREQFDISNDKDCDVKGTIIDESLLGIEVIGNIYDNPELLKK